MSVYAWRIAVEAPSYSANDMSGKGAESTGGRWNSKGKPVIYCAANVALSVLETLHDLRSGALPFNRFLVQIEIPDDLHAARVMLAPPPGGWDAIPPEASSRQAGDDWIDSGRSAVLQVPSVIVPEESNFLINPAHRDAARVVATTVKRWLYDPRLFP